MNNLQIEIFNSETGEWVDYTQNAINDYKWADLLDEQLDESTVTLIRTSDEYILPMTRIKITSVNNPSAKYTFEMANSIAQNSDYGLVYAGNNIWQTTSGFLTMTLNSDGTITQVKEKQYFVIDDNSTEIPNGNGKFNHELYLIELTKILEGFIGDSISFTNPLGNNFIND